MDVLLELLKAWKLAKLLDRQSESVMESELALVKANLLAEVWDHASVRLKFVFSVESFRRELNQICRCFFYKHYPGSNQMPWTLD
jgi:hypothetical protein